MKKIIPLSIGVVVVLLLLAAGWTAVDSTEHCVLTRYGEVVKERMGNGLNWTPLADATCFPTTDQNYPPNDVAEEVEAQTRDPVTITGDVAIVYEYANIVQLFKDKRTPDAARNEVLNSIRDGFRSAMAGWSINRLFSAERSAFADSVQAHIQRKIGERARIKRVFVRQLKAPPSIEEARISAAKQAQVLDQARTQKTIDSTNAVSALFAQEMDARARRLQMEALASTPQALQLKSMEALANGLANLCPKTAGAVCIVGGGVLDQFLAGVRK